MKNNKGWACTAETSRWTANDYLIAALTCWRG